MCGPRVVYDYRQTYRKNPWADHKHIVDDTRIFHFIDYVVHGWDVATTLGTDPGFDPDLVHDALEQAARVPGGDARLAPGAAFRPGVAVQDDAPDMDRLLAVLGRSPAWPS